MAEPESTEVEDTRDESLSELFNDEPEPEAEPEDKGEVKAEPEPEAKAEEPEPEEPEPAAEPPSAERGQLAALLAERDKRQKLEKELEELRGQQSTPDPIEDPQGYADHIKNETTTNELSTRITLSRDMMLEVDPDFARLEGVFMGLVVDSDGQVIDQSLLNQFQTSPNPAKFARDHAKNHERIKELSDPKYAENLEAQIRAKVLKEIEDAAKSTVNVPDLTQAAAVKDDVPVNSDSMSDIFDGQPI